MAGCVHIGILIAVRATGTGVGGVAVSLGIAALGSVEEAAIVNALTNITSEGDALCAGQQNRVVLISQGLGDDVVAHLGQQVELTVGVVVVGIVFNNKTLYHLNAVVSKERIVEAAKLRGQKAFEKAKGFSTGQIVTLWEDYIKQIVER